MATFPSAAYAAAQCRALDRQAAEHYGLPGGILMERAGAAVCAELRCRYPQAGHVTVLCGLGNNAGDGYVLARLLREAGVAVSVFQCGDASALQGDARAAADAYAAVGGSALPAAALSELGGTDVVVDALLGTGLSREVDGEFAQAIQWANQQPSPVVAVDVPSGLYVDTGCPMGLAVRADVTVTFIALKMGMLTGVALDYVGECVFADLGVPEALYSHEVPPVHVIQRKIIAESLPRRRRDSHKGTYGHVLAMGGDYGMAGAIRLAAEAAARAGAGLITVATRPGHEVAIHGARPELMCVGVDDLTDLARVAGRASVWLVGPGLGQSGWSNKLLRAALAAEKPVIVDADGLNLLPGYSSKPPARWILTPHPGEAARLLVRDIVTVQRDRYAAARELATRYQATVVLKGAGTLVATPQGHMAVCTYGNPGMASGGMGDVLAGIIAGLVAQGLDDYTAACCGVALHALAGDAVANKHGERGMLAMDLFLPIQEAVNGRLC
jgi:ADP-dependent NAD(P)H-hydrate dehydratase / NAD(P)H-hydrate epimerase